MYKIKKALKTRSFQSFFDFILRGPSISILDVFEQIGIWRYIVFFFRMTILTHLMHKIHVIYVEI